MKPITATEARQRIMHILIDIGFEGARDLARGEVQPGETEGKVIAALTELISELIDALPEEADQ